MVQDRYRNGTFTRYRSNTGQVQISTQLGPRDSLPTSVRRKKGSSILERSWLRVRVRVRNTGKLIKFKSLKTDLLECE